MLRIESHVFALCTILVLLLHTFAVEANPDGNKNNDWEKEDTSDSDDDDIEINLRYYEDTSDSDDDYGETYAGDGWNKEIPHSDNGDRVKRILDKWDAQAGDTNELSLNEVDENKRKFLENYISLMKFLKKKEVYVPTKLEENFSELLKTAMKNLFNVLSKRAFILVLSTETIFEDCYRHIMHYKKGKRMLKPFLGVLFDNNRHWITRNTKDWLYLLSKEIFDPSRKLFKYVDPNDTNGYLEIDPDSKNNEDYLNHFKFVGRVFGLALYYEKRIRVNLKPAFYTRILREYPKIDPKTDPKDYPLWKKTEEQMSAFIEGLTDLIPLDKLREFNVSELQSLFCDTGYLDLEQWKKHTSYTSTDKDAVYEENDKQVVWFWDIIEEYNESDRRKVLLFATGTDALPITVFINDWVTFKINKKIITSHRIVQHIRARESFKTIQLPRYGTKEKLMNEMKMIVGKMHDEKMN